MKKLMIFSAIGLVIGDALATYFGPDLLTWWFESPVNISVNCTEPIRWAMNKLILVQLTGGAIGFVVALVLSFLVFNKKKESVD